MNKFNHDLFPALLSATLTSTLVLASSFYHSVQANPQPKGARETLPSNSLISISFQAPGDTVPETSVGGGVRGTVQFSTPGEAAPESSVGGGVRGTVQFSTPGEAAPDNSVGGGVRGEVSFDPPGDDSPVNTISGGTRTDELLAMTALLPTNQHGRTVVARPTFFVYLPATSSKEVFFSLQDEQGNHHYQTTLEISGRGGIIGITLPDESPELEVGKNYMWFFAPIEPNSILRPDNAGVTGWVKRVESLAQDGTVLSSEPIKLATEYAQQGIWYDTLNILVAAQLDQPNDVTLVSEWTELLEQVELDAIASQPIAEQL